MIFAHFHEVVFAWLIFFFMKLAIHHAFAHFHEFGNMSMCPSVGLSVGLLETLLLFGLLGATNAVYTAQCLFLCLVFAHFLEIIFCAFSQSQKNDMVFAYFREAENLLWFFLISLKLTIFHGVGISNTLLICSVSRILWFLLFMKFARFWSFSWCWQNFMVFADYH